MEGFKIVNDYEDIERNTFFKFKEGNRITRHKVALAKEQCMLVGHEKVALAKEQCMLVGHEKVHILTNGDI